MKKSMKIGIICMALLFLLIFVSGCNTPEVTPKETAEPTDEPIAEHQHTVVADNTAIGESAFEFCESKSQIRIPSSIKSIGKKAFKRIDRRKRYPLLL